MSLLRSPLVRVALVLIVIGALLYMPTREFFKITFFAAIPVIILTGFMNRKRKFSLPWIAALILVIGITGIYAFNLTQLPDRIEYRKIISEGSAMLAEGRFEEARQEFVKLEQVGREERMKQKLEEVDREQEAHRQLDLARELIAAGDTAAAMQILEEIDPNTRAAAEANRVLKELKG